MHISVNQAKKNCMKRLVSLEFCFLVVSQWCTVFQRQLSEVAFLRSFLQLTLVVCSIPMLFHRPVNYWPATRVTWLTECLM